MFLPISEETKESLMKDCLKQDFKFAYETHMEFKRKAKEEGPLEDYQEIDRKAAKRLYKALRVVMCNYFHESELKGVEGLV